MEKVIDKIKKLLAVADPSKNPSEHEVQTALLKAQELMAKHGLEMQDIKEEEKPEVVEEKLDTSCQTASTWRMMLANVLGKNFKTKILKINTRSGSFIRVIGMKTDVEVTKVTYAYVLGAFEQLFRMYLNRRKRDEYLTRSDSLRIRNDYLMGFLVGLDKAFTKQVTEMGLIVIAPEAVDRHIKDNYKVKSVQAHMGESSGDQDAMRQGYDDGASLNDRAKLGGESMLIRKKTVDGYTQLYRPDNDDWITMDETLLGMLGLVYRAGYVGSSIFVEINWNPLHSIELKQMIRRRTQVEFQIDKDTDSQTTIDIRGIRSQLQELGMTYKLYDLLPLSFLDQESQILAFVKGYLLGDLSNDTETEYTTTGNITFHVQGVTLWEAMLELLELVTIPYISSEDNFTITLLGGEGSKNEWFMNQKTFIGG